MEKYNKKKKYDKLVRDKIPEFLSSKNIEHKTHTANEKEYRQKLLQKLVEESIEFNEEPTPEELGDVLEVILAIMELPDFKKKVVEKSRLEKLSKRGGYTKRIILDES